MSGGFSMSLGAAPPASKPKIGIAAFGDAAIDEDAPPPSAAPPRPRRRKSVFDADDDDDATPLQAPRSKRDAAAKPPGVGRRLFVKTYTEKVAFGHVLYTFYRVIILHAM